MTEEPQDPGLDGFGPLYVGLTHALNPEQPLYMLVKRDDSTSCLPAWFSEEGLFRFLGEKKLEGQVTATVLMRAGHEWTRRLVAGMGHELVLKIED